jgi:hypothetical protein
LDEAPADTFVAADEIKDWYVSDDDADDSIGCTQRKPIRLKTPNDIVAIDRCLLQCYHSSSTAFLIIFLLIRHAKGWTDKVQKKPATRWINCSLHPTFSFSLYTITLDLKSIKESSCVSKDKVTFHLKHFQFRWEGNHRVIFLGKTSLADVPLVALHAFRRNLSLLKPS